jgi:dihydrolipoamide dehydrogenase
MEYDLAVIGAGWAGYNAAVKAKESGLKVCLVEKNLIGGTCLNLGCIPTKTLIQSSKVFSTLKKSANFGIEASPLKINFVKIQERKEHIIQQLRAGMESRLKGIDLIHAAAEVTSSGEIKAGERLIRAKSILVACGSRPAELGNLKFDHKKVISSDDLLNIKEIPASLLIIGGGVIGCEFACLFNSLGSAVTIIEKMPQLLPGLDSEIARRLEGLFKKKGIKISTNTDATTFNLNAYELVLLSVGRIPNNLGLDLTVDAYLRTKTPNIYAAGDCTGKLMLAHFAAYQGEIAAHNIAHPDNPRKADNSVVPNCVFTDPQIACVGLSEDEAKAQRLDFGVNKFDFLGSGMARIMDEVEGFIKIISENKSARILGASIIGPKATELIGMLTLAISSGLKISDIKNTILAHPTLSESIGEALK